MNRIDRCIEAKKRGFKYCKKTGNIYGSSGKLITKTTNNGYVSFSIMKNNKSYYILGHVYAFFYSKGFIPELIDHKNRIKNDNRFSNLRPSNKRLNAYNNGCRGTCFDKAKRKWTAGITINGKRVFLGYFDNEQKANQAYIEKKNNVVNSMRSEITSLRKNT